MTPSLREFMHCEDRTISWVSNQDWKPDILDIGDQNTHPEALIRSNNPKDNRTAVDSVMSAWLGYTSLGSEVCEVCIFAIGNRNPVHDTQAGQSVALSYRDILQKDEHLNSGYVGAITYASKPVLEEFLNTLTDNDLETEFRTLADKWREETGMLSSTSKKAMHPAYQQIIGMGKRAIPLILQELKERPSHWFVALRSITGENPAPPEAAGCVKKIADAWIEWGQKKGHIA